MSQTTKQELIHRIHDIVRTWELGHVDAYTAMNLINEQLNPPEIPLNIDDFE